MPDAQAEQFSRMHGLFLSDIDPPAIGHNFWTAFKNQRLTSSGVSLFGIVQVLYYTCTNHFSRLLFYDAERCITRSISGYRLRGVREACRCFHLHFLTPYGSSLDLVPYYPSALALIGEANRWLEGGFWRPSLPFNASRSATL